MKTVHGTENRLPARRRVTALGMFDGVHRGHQRILAEVTAWATTAQAEATVLTFDQHPLAVLGRKAPPSITTLDQRLALFEKQGLGLCVVLHFDESLAGMSPEQFAREILRDYLHATAVVMGFDQRFGHKDEGSTQTMQMLGQRLGFDVRVIPPLAVGGHIISSTAVRRAIAAGDLRTTRRMLGRPYALYGRVIPASGFGRKLGFPTANLELHNEVTPPEGVYLTRTAAEGRLYPSLTHIGTRPSLVHTAPTEADTVTIETYIDGFSGNLYGRDVCVELLERRRDIIAFRSSGELTAQLERDLRALRRALEEGRIQLDKGEAP